MRRKPERWCPRARHLQPRRRLAPARSREFHGYEIAKQLTDLPNRRLTAYGTLYRALGRLEVMGLLRSRWEDPEIPARESRPGRRLYTLTVQGEAAVGAARREAASSMSTRGRRRYAPA